MVRIGIVGAGKICQGPHMGAYDKIDNVEIVSICDINEKRLEEAKKRYPNATLYSDYKEMIDKEKLDFVFSVVVFVMHTPSNLYNKPKWKPKKEKFQKLFIIPKKIMIRGITLLNVQNDMGDVPTMFC